MEKALLNFVLSFRKYLRHKKKVYFTGRKLIDHFYTQIEIKPLLKRADLTAKIAAIFANSKSSKTYIVPKNGKGYSFTDSGKVYLFLDAYIEIQGDKKKAINCKYYKLYFKSNLPVFYLPESKTHFFLSKPHNLISRVTETIKDIIMKGSAENGLKFNYPAVAASTRLTDRFQQLIHCLPFLKSSYITESTNKKKAFFINMYNVMHIHTVILFFSKKGFSKDLSPFQRFKLLNSTIYNICGVNLSLNDIEHGILRNNNNFGNKGFKTFWQVMLGKPYNDTSKKRFSENDIREKFVVGNEPNPKVDFRIHFALNCGANSCPMLNVYEHETLENSLENAAFTFCNSVSIKKEKNLTIFTMSLIFKWYLDDFGQDYKEMLWNIRKYTRSDVQHAITTVCERSAPFTISWEHYDWDLNIDCFFTDKSINTV